MLLFTVIPALSHAGPNNNIANRLTILNIPPLPKTVTGDNFSASSNESGEIDPLGGNSSVWWQWTPNFTGWAQIDTAGSNFDTILYAFIQTNPSQSNPDVDDLILIASNDDNTGDATTSRLNVFATSGLKIHIAVHGFDEAEGNITLNLSPVSPAPPGNDNFAAPTPLGTVASSSVSGSDVNATIEGLENDSLDIGGNSVWWTWSPTATGWYSIDTFGSLIDTVLYVYSGASLGTLTELEANDDDNGFDTESRVVLNASAGQTYRIAVHGFEGDSGAIDLNIASVPAPPPNDDFADRTSLGTTNSSNAMGSNISATTEGTEPDPEELGGASAWWTWTSLSGGWKRIDTIGSDFDTVLYVFDGAGTVLEDLVLVAQSDDRSGNNLTSHLNLNTMAGQTYHIAVHGLAGDTGSVNLNIAPTPTPPSNDNFVGQIALGSIPLGGSTLSTTGSNISATFELDEPDPLGNGGASVWWTVVAPDTRWYRIDTIGSSFDTVVYVYNNGTLITINTLKANDDATSATVQSALNFQGSLDQHYAIAVCGFGGATGSISLNIRESNPHPVNDDFNSWQYAGSATPYTNTMSSVDATIEGSEPDPLGLGGASLWWKWVAPSTGRFEVNTMGSAINTLLYVFDDAATIDALNLLASSNDINGSTFASRLNFAATIGQTYRFAVHGVAGAEGSATLNLSAVADPPVNDHFASAINLGNSSAVSTGIDTTSATFEPFEPDSLDIGGASAWWKWTAPASGPVTIDTGGSDYNTVLYVYTGSDIDNLVEIASNNDALGTLQSRVSFSAVAATEYRIALHGFNGAAGSARLQISRLPPYPTWLARYPGLAGPNALPGADPDDDRFTNLEELVFGLDPAVNSSNGAAGDPHAANAPVFEVVPGAMLQIFFTIDPLAINAGIGPPITINGRWSFALQGWDTLAPISLGGNDYKVEIPIDASPKKFLSIIIDDPNP